MTILTAEAFAAAPALALIATGEHKTLTAVGAALGRDQANFSKAFAAYQAAGWVAREKGQPPGLTDAGRAVLAALDRANNPTPDAQGVAEYRLDLIDEDPELNPRKAPPQDSAAQKARAEEDAELQGSIAEKGVLQPILIRQGATPGRFRVVAGSRRRRNALAAGLATIPALYREMTDAQAHEAATVENVQRADMTELEEARAAERIIRDQRAADPAMTLKQAKEYVAAKLKKTVRFVEYRLALLELPAAKKEALEAGDLTVTDARKWLAARPKPLKLTARQWLIALEVFDAQERNPAPKLMDYEGNAAPCLPQAADDADVLALQDHRLLTEVQEIEDADGLRTGRFKVRFSEHALEQLRMKFGAVDHEDTAQDALKDARLAVFGEPSPDAALGPGEFATDWLNGPFEPSEAALAEIEAERAELRRQEQARAERDRDARTAFETARAEGMRRYSAAVEVEQRLAGAKRKALDPLIAVILEGGDKPLPWFPTGLGGVLAANGAVVFFDYPAHTPPEPDVLARVKLIAVAMNAAAGLATPDEPPATPDDAGAEDLRDVGEEAEDAGEIEAPEDQVEDEPETEDAAADADEPIPPFLRRLASGSASPAHP